MKQALSTTELLISPAATDENMHSIAIFVTVRYPDGTRMRRAAPMTVFPRPMTVPDPDSTNPNKCRTGGNRDRFNNRRRRRFSDHDFLAYNGWRRRLPVNCSFAHHTTVHQQ